MKHAFIPTVMNAINSVWGLPVETLNVILDMDTNNGHIAYITSETCIFHAEYKNETTYWHIHKYDHTDYRYSYDGELDKGETLNE